MPTCGDAAIDVAEAGVPLLAEQGVCLLQWFPMLGPSTGHWLNGSLERGYSTVREASRNTTTWCKTPHYSSEDQKYVGKDKLWSSLCPFTCVWS